MPNAKILPFTSIAPGSKGLNKQLSGQLLDAAWAVEAQNCVFNSNNMLASRPGWAAQNASPISGTPDLEQIFEYKPASPTANLVVSAGGNKLYVGVNTITDITGVLAPTANSWKFVNFNGNVYGLQAAHPLIQYTGAGNFTATVPASGAVPTGNELLSAFGRLWAVNSDKQTIVYTGLLDATNWGGVGSGNINLTNVWLSGGDEIVALAAFNNFLVVFGKKNVVLYTDGTGSKLGIDPANIRVGDIVTGVGCIARDTVVNVNGDDLVFLSASGLQSLQRLMVNKSNPLRNVSPNIRDYITSSVTSENVAKIRATYVPRQGYYLLLLPATRIILCFDTKVVLDDNSWRVTEWNTFIPKSVCCLEDGATVYGGLAGYIYQNTGYNDNGNSFRYIYRSGWLDLEQSQQGSNNYLKFIKKLTAIVFVTGNANVQIKWGFDFSPNMNTISKTISGGTAGGQYGNISQVTGTFSPGQYGLAQYGASVGLVEMEIPAYAAGQFIRIGVEVDLSSSSFALQQMQMFAKIGRLY